MMVYILKMNPAVYDLAYKDLIRIIKSYAKALVLKLKAFPSIIVSAMVDEIKSYIELALKVIDQTERRVIESETVER